MDESVLNIFYIVLSAACTQIPILVEIALKISVDCLSYRVASNIKFSVFVQKWSLAVLLNNVRPLLPVYVRVANDLPNLTQLAANCDSAASVGVLARLHNPKLGAHSRILGKIWV